MDKINIQTKQSFTASINKVMQAMGLKTLLSNIDYSSPLPNIVVIYPDKDKYYLVEPVSLECLSEKSQRLYREDEYKDIRKYCARLFKDNHVTASILSAIICDMAAGVEMFTYKVVKTYELISMAKYASLAVPCQYEKEACEALSYLKLEYRTLNVLDQFTFILIDKTQTIKLPEIKKFIKFILTNQ